MSPRAVILGGPNGAGKTTAARGLLHGLIELGEFVNADTIASGLSGFAPDRAAFAAGRIMLSRLHELAESRANFAFETTMASRSFAPWLEQLRKTNGYETHIAYFWLRSPRLAAQRVARRVREGGHNIPPETIERRYHRGLQNFFDLYLPIATTWVVFDNSAEGSPLLVASGRQSEPIIIHDSPSWQRILKQAAASSTSNRS
jgi:predicted ABC-type ATPase